MPNSSRLRSIKSICAKTGSPGRRLPIAKINLATPKVFFDHISSFINGHPPLKFRSQLGGWKPGLARPLRFELRTLCLEGRCSIQLSYGRKPGRSQKPEVPCQTSSLSVPFHLVLTMLDCAARASPRCHTSTILPGLNGALDQSGDCEPLEFFQKTRVSHGASCAAVCS
jgi:hypothetical protein